MEKKWIAGHLRKNLLVPWKWVAQQFWCAQEQLRENVADALIPLCTDSSDKARASGLRAVGCMAELGLKHHQVQELADLQLRFCKQHGFLYVTGMHHIYASQRSPFFVYFSRFFSSKKTSRESTQSSWRQKMSKSSAFPKAHGGSEETTSQVSMEWLPFSRATGSSNRRWPRREEVDGSSLWLVCQDEQWPKPWLLAVYRGLYYPVI